MSISLRDQRCRIYAYDEAQTEAISGNSGYWVPTAMVVASGDRDHAWWCRVEQAHGRETATAMPALPDTGAVVISLNAEVPVPVDLDGLAKGLVLLLNADGSGGPLFSMLALRPRRSVGEVQIEGKRIDNIRQFKLEDVA